MLQYNENEPRYNSSDGKTFSLGRKVKFMIFKITPAVKMGVRLDQRPTCRCGTASAMITEYEL